MCMYMYMYMWYIQAGMGNLQPLIMTTVQQITSDNSAHQIGRTIQEWMGCCTETENFDIGCKYRSHS